MSNRVLADEGLGERLVGHADALKGFQTITPVDEDAAVAVPVPKQNGDRLPVGLDVLA